MKKCIWFALLVPTLTACLPIALCAAAATRNSGAVLFVLGASLSTMLGIAWMLDRQQALTRGRLRNPESRGLNADRTGIFHSLLAEMLQIVAKAEAESLAAAQERMEVAARLRLRHKQIERLERAFDAVPHPVLVTDGGDEIVLCNQAAWKLLKLASPSDAPTSGKVFQNWSGFPELQGLLAETRVRGDVASARSVECDIATPQGPRSFRALALHLCDEEGAALGVVAVLQDIGQEKAANSRHAEFVSSVCHELKTPMASMKAFVEMLMDGEIEDQEEQQRLYGFIDVQIDRLTRLVNNMLNLARIESGVIQVQRVDCGLSEVLGKAFEVMGPMAREKGITLVSQLSDMYLPVHVDRDLLGQAALNLLSNAVKYTPAGGEVRLRSRMLDGEAVFDIHDNGMGIPPEDLGKLFQRFFRVERNANAAPGTGLGLALVQYIVQAIHGGRVTVQSEVEKGSCFTVSIPLGHRAGTRRKPELAACASR